VDRGHKGRDDEEYLYILDAEDQLSAMKLSDNDDPKTHLSEMKQHFQLMLQRHENLMKMGSEISDTRFNTLIMSSLPESYRPTLQTITASERANALTGGSNTKMKSSDLIAFLLEEAQHRAINDERSRGPEQALATQAKWKGKGKGKAKQAKSDDKALNADSEITCHNCGKKGHKKLDCWAEGGGKAGQGPRQRKGKKAETATVAATEDDDKFFAFTCTSDFANVAEALQVPKSRLGTCIDSGASRVYSPDRSKFTNYKPIDRGITTADGRQLKATGMGDLEIEMLNASGSKTTSMTFKNAIHAPEMAFTLISISRLDKAGYQVNFNKGMCKILNPKGRVIATIPHSNGLYRITSKATKDGGVAAAVSGKMSITEAHRKLGHLAYGAVTHAIEKGYIAGIELDTNSKPEFCEACAKAKSARQPFPKESKT